MSHKRYYIVMILVLCSSVLFLGLSYSSSSGNSTLDINEIEKDNARIVYSDEQIIDNDQQLDIGITNLSELPKKYKIFISEIYGDNNNIYYTLNNSEKKPVENNTILISDLSEYKTKNDYSLNSIKIYGSKGNKYKIDVVFDEDIITNTIEEVPYDSE